MLHGLPVRALVILLGFLKESLAGARGHVVQRPLCLYVGDGVAHPMLLREIEVLTVLFCNALHDET